MQQCRGEKVLSKYSLLFSYKISRHFQSILTLHVQMISNSIGSTFNRWIVKRTTWIILMSCQINKPKEQNSLMYAIKNGILIYLRKNVFSFAGMVTKLNGNHHITAASSTIFMILILKKRIDISNGIVAARKWIFAPFSHSDPYFLRSGKQKNNWMEKADSSWNNIRCMLSIFHRKLA